MGKENIIECPKCKTKIDLSSLRESTINKIYKNIRDVLEV